MSLGCHGRSTALLLEPLDLPSLSCPLGSDTFLRDARHCPGPLSCSNSGDTPDPVHPSLPLLSPISRCRTTFFNPASNQSRVPGRKSLHLAFVWPLLASHSSVSGTASPHPPPPFPADVQALSPRQLHLCKFSLPPVLHWLPSLRLMFGSLCCQSLLCSCFSVLCFQMPPQFSLHFTLCCWVV